MSRGFGAIMTKVLEDDQYVIYEYGSYDLNYEGFRNEDKILDGIITIKKSCFVEPEIHEKIKRIPGKKKKKIIKRVPVFVDYSVMLRDGDITVENCSHTRETSAMGIDVLALKMLFYLFLKYQEESEIPEKFSVHF